MVSLENNGDLIECSSLVLSECGLHADLRFFFFSFSR